MGNAIAPLATTLGEAHVRERLAQVVPTRFEGCDSTRYAAVAAVLRLNDTPEVLLIERAQQEGDRWSGHMALPGGMREPHDQNLLATAIRETEEELSLTLQHKQFVTRLDDVQAIARGKQVDLIIVPHVFIWHGEAPLTPNEEVADTLWAPLLPMMAGDLDTVRPYRHNGHELPLPGFRVGGRVVWGLTHRMLELLFEAIR
ncbi:MAG TPA: CoA pyrophosphatase [Sorangium sp.]|nr:CoA pyrophosphatase [Sorangium sp.]